MFLIGGSTPECDQAGKIYNTCAVYSPQGKLLTSHYKMHLFDIDIPGGMSFRESDTLSSGNEITIVDLDRYGKIGIGICYDMRFAEVSTIVARKGAFALVFPSAFNTVTGPLHWELLGRSRAADNQVYSIPCPQSRAPPPSYPAFEGISWSASRWVELLLGPRRAKTPYMRHWSRVLSGCLARRFLLATRRDMTCIQIREARLKCV